MKKKVATLLAVSICMCSLLSPISGNADASLSAVTISTDTFTYTAKYHGFDFESELASPDFMVIGCDYSIRDPEKISSYFVVPINQKTKEVGTISANYIKEYLGDVSLYAGDLLQIDETWLTAESSPPQYVPIEDSTLTFLGNGVEVFGDEFKKVVFMQLVHEYMKFDYDAPGSCKLNWIQGDVTIDDALNILDCIVINKHLLTGSELCDYAKFVGDIDANGKLDFTDSLAILKESIGITVDFE